MQSTEQAQMISGAVHAQEVHVQHLGLLYIDRIFQSQLEPGIHGWWSFNRSFKSEAIDLRLQTVEVSVQLTGQENRRFFIRN